MSLFFRLNQAAIKQYCSAWNQQDSKHAKSSKSTSHADLHLCFILFFFGNQDCTWKIQIIFLHFKFFNMLIGVFRVFSWFRIKLCSLYCTCLWNDINTQAFQIVLCLLSGWVGLCHCLPVSKHWHIVWQLTPLHALLLSVIWQTDLYQQQDLPKYYPP